MLKVYYRTLVSTWKTFGFGSVFLILMLILPFFFLFTHLTLSLDRIFFSQYSKVEVKNPIFIMGGRGGTTFLHRLLSKTGDLAAFEAWHLIFPALTARFLVKPLINYLIRTDRATLTPAESGHEIKLNKVEEDEFIFLHKIDTQFVTLLTPLAFDEQEHPELRYYDLQPDQRRKSSADFYRSCIQRQILFTGKEQFVGKLTYSIYRLKTLMETFPNGKFIFLIRSPHEAIPSYLSLHHQLLDHQWGLENIPQDKLKRFFERIYRHSIELYSYPYKLLKSQEISEERLLILSTEQLTQELEETFAKIVAFTEMKPSKELLQAVAEQAKAQRNYRRKHRVAKPEEFDITREQITKDFSFIFEEYGFDKNSEIKAVT
jgi:hypothetical protein